MVSLLISLMTGADWQSSKSNWGLLGLSGDDTIRPSPSMPALRTVAQQSTSGFSSTLSPPTATTSALTPPPRGGILRRAASTIALQKFMQEKGVELGPDDADVLEHLARDLREVRTQSSPNVGLGGWSAGITAPNGNGNDAHLTPLKQTASAPSVGTPGSSFSVGSNAPLHPSRASTSGRQVTYLGPGMSPRRLAPRNKPTMKPLFEGIDRKDDAGKKRKVDSAESEDSGSSSSPSSAPGTAAAAAMAAAFNKGRIVSGSSTRPSPLNQSTTVVPSPDRVQAGKRRAADIMKEVIDAELGPRKATKPSLVISEYDEPRLPSTMAQSSSRVAATRSSLRKSSSGSKLAARASMSASRGAAGQLERSRGSTRKLSVLELVSGINASTEDAPEPEAEDAEMDEVAAPPSAFSFKPAAPAAPAPSPKPVTKVPEPEVFKALPVPSLSQSTLGQSTSKAPSKSPTPVSTESAAVDSIVAASKPTPAPAFNPRPVGLGPPPAAAASSLANRAGNRAVATVSRRVDPSAIYLSAKDSALNVEKAALPFFTFTLPPQTKGQPSTTVKEAAHSRPKESFNFTMSQPALPSALLSPPSSHVSVTTPLPTVPDESPEPIKVVKPAGEWTCSLCMLQNPASATEKCSICEAPKPGAAPAVATKPISMPAPPSVPAAGGFTFGGKPVTAPATTTPAPGGFTGFGKPAAPKPAAAGGADWDCGLCMLKNPASATEKCSICEAPRPGATPSASSKPAAPPAPPSVPAGGFSFGGSSSSSSAAPKSSFMFGKPPAAAGEWECDTCMLKNPATATEKCTVCEAPKPGATVSTPAAPKGGLPAPPAGGFSFGGKPVATAPPSAPSTGLTGFSFGVKPPGTAAAAPSFGAPPAGGFSFGAKPPTTGSFSFGAPAAPALLAKPTGAADEWTCDTCMLKNPATATEKCTICETPKP